MYTKLLLLPLKDVLNHFPHYVFAAFLGAIFSVYSGGQIIFILATIILGYVGASFFYWCLNTIVLANIDCGKWINLYIAIITMLAVVGSTYAMFTSAYIAMAVTALATSIFLLNRYLQTKLWGSK